MKLGWIEISFTWHGPGSKTINQRKLDKLLRAEHAKDPKGGGFINAIKLHRQLTKSSLKDAKDHCDKLFGRGPCFN